MKGLRIQIKPIYIAAVILIVFLMYNLTGLNVLFVAGCSILIVWCILGSDGNVFLTLLVLMPNVMMIKHLSSTLATVGYATLIYEWRYILKKTVQNRKLSVTLETILFCFSVCFTFVFTQSFSYLSSAVRVISFALFSFLFFSEDKYKRKEYFDETIYCYSFGVACSVILGIIYWLAKGQNIFVGYFAGIRNDRNFFSATVSLGIAVSSLYYVTSTNKEYTRKYPIVIVVLIIGGLLSCSRTFMVSLLFSIAIILKYSMSLQKMKRMSVLIAFLALSVILVSKDERIVQTVQNTILRFSADDMSGGNGRFYTWMIYLEDFSSSIWSILFGKGSERAIEPMMSQFMATHNTFIQGLYCGGIFGILSYILLFFKIFRRMARYGKVKIIELFPIADLLLCRFFIASYMSDAFSFELLIAVIVAVYRVSGAEENENYPNQHHLRCRQHRENCCFDQ